MAVIPLFAFILMVAGAIGMLVGTRIKNPYLVSLSSPAYWIGLFFVTWSLSKVIFG